jgi:hypothetical protein
MSDNDFDVSAMSDEELAKAASGEFEPETKAAPETPAEPQPEATAEAQEQAPAQEPQHEKPTHVPVEALTEERAKRRQIQEQYEARMAEMQQRLDQITALFQQPAQQEDPVPSYEEDPLGHLKRQVETMGRTLQERAQQEQQERAYRAQQEQIIRLRDAVGQQEVEFAKNHPDYFDAATHIRTTRAAQLEARGANPQQIAEVLAQEAVGIAQQAYALGQSPAEYVYRMAQAAGWQRKPPVSLVQNEAPKSLGAASGKADDALPENADIGSMSDAEFDAYFKKHWAPR